MQIKSIAESEEKAQEGKKKMEGAAGRQAMIGSHEWIGSPPLRKEKGIYAMGNKHLLAVLASQSESFSEGQPFKGLHYEPGSSLKGRGGQANIGLHCSIGHPPPTITRKRREHRREGLQNRKGPAATEWEEQPKIGLQCECGPSPFYPQISQQRFLHMSLRTPMDHALRHVLLRRLFGNLR